MRKFLALPIEGKTTHVARKMTKPKNAQVEELKEKNEREKVLNQIKSKMVIPKQRSSKHELKITMLKGGKRRKNKEVQTLPNINQNVSLTDF